MTPKVCCELMALDVSSLRCLNSQALHGRPKPRISCDTPVVSDPYLVLCTTRNLEKQTQLIRACKNPTGQNRGLIFHSELLTPEWRFQHGTAPFESFVLPCGAGQFLETQRRESKTSVPLAQRRGRTGDRPSNPQPLPPLPRSPAGEGSRARGATRQLLPTGRGQARARRHLGSKQQLKNKRALKF